VRLVVLRVKMPETALHINDPHPCQNVQYVDDAPAHRRRKPTGSILIHGSSAST